jgi:single-strand DNA-binding protein
MAYLNKVMLIGNVGKDPQISMTPSGKKRVSFSLATSKRYRDQNGEQKEQTEWHNVVGWGKTAEIVEQLGICKGTSLYVEGELTNRSWTDNQGQKRSMTEVNLSTFQLLTPRTQGATQGQQGSVFGQSVASDYQQNMAQQQAYASGDDDDLPF